MFTRAMVLALSCGALTFGCASEPVTDNADDIQEDEDLTRQELSRDLEATTSLADQPRPIGDTTSVTVAISVSTSNTIVFNPSSLTVVPGEFVTFTSTVAGTLTVPADIFGNVGPFSMTAGGIQRVPVLSNVRANTSGQARFTAGSNPNLTGPITIGTGVG